MSVFVLKLIAMITMVIDHTAIVLEYKGLVSRETYLLLREIGRCAFPIYAFLMAEAYRHLKDRPDRLRAHLGKLLVLMALSEIPFDFFLHHVPVYPEGQSVIPTLALGFVGLILGASAKGKPAYQVFLLACAAALGYLLSTDYGMTGVILVLSFYPVLLAREKAGLWSFLLPGLALGVNLLLRVPFHTAAWTGPALLAALESQFRWWPAYLVTAALLALYNGRLGPNPRPFRWVYSWFYPLHLAGMCLWLML